ncbi:bifunctional 4-hydroxy-2-oxoglutarate aldolase/2-dehydro-3-deoxy-phosphogluconate aldolase [Saccharothrix obliqua]|uniref:bifunctional 4-hydroxy-2-oxoglutarate aldolase/2-dehydro-3-deoxy-phosphogluconate aldolase n=1 Tax=Saccharothrix obliqua TaxID=2861747 RepID=UPI001C5E9F30|nr:bifunctional 4-hydroxy-2-oxoglutarate aldolase/2-dehydro-3-deoxy-phosphogluconate aldolase [Saccharothrix obliqua]MBW4721373.1 bifunctional 4-hydroxy-2-oxoglutarate aldolase/2-dehydro-3-deoxy-phosphogluconate aldolase [Saccharothrix obliqua]
MSEFFERGLARVPVIAILRGLGPETTVERARMCWAAGVELVEVPVQGPVDAESLTATVEAAGDRPVGAGTVLTAAQAETALGLGARFLVAPSVSARVAAVAAGADCPYLPGVATPTETADALELGLTWMKAFPAGSLAADWYAAMSAPFPTARFVAVGGVNAANSRAHLDRGAAAVGVGSGLGAAAEISALVASCDR